MLFLALFIQLIWTVVTLSKNWITASFLSSFVLSKCSSQTESSFHVYSNTPLSRKTCPENQRGGGGVG